MKYTLSTNKEMIKTYGIRRHKTYMRVLRLSRGKYSPDDIRQLPDLDNFIILKSTQNFKIVSTESFLKLEWADYMLLKREFYSEHYVNEWLNFISLNKIGVSFLGAPFPPLSVLEKIKTYEIHAINQ